MAKNKVINTVLNLRDNMSGGLLKAAQNAKKSSAKIDDSMIQSTRKVIAFKNKAVSAMQEFAKKSALAAGAAVPPPLWRWTARPRNTAWRRAS